MSSQTGPRSIAYDRPVRSDRSMQRLIVVAFGSFVVGCLVIAMAYVAAVLLIARVTLIP